MIIYCLIEKMYGDPFVNLEKSSHKPKYNEKVTGIDHKGEIIFFEPTKIEKKK